jgi:hypothetical protein
MLSSVRRSALVSSSFRRSRNATTTYRDCGTKSIHCFASFFLMNPNVDIDNYFDAMRRLAGYLDGMCGQFADYLDHLRSFLTKSYLNMFNHLRCF